MVATRALSFRGDTDIDRLWAIEVFVRVAECGSFSRAAESLNLANATVTTCLRRLERHLGVTLINRNTRRLRLTEEGQTYLRRAREVLETMARAEEELRTQAGELRGRLRIETPISLGHSLLCPALPEFAKRYPGISTTVTLSNQPHHIIEHALDVAIRMDHVEDADLVARPIYESRYIVCCAPGLADALPPHPRDLDRQRCIGILPEGQQTVRPWVLRKDDEEIDLSPDGSLHFNSSDALLEAAEAGIGVTCVLDVFVNRRLAAGSLVQVYADWETPLKTFYFVMPKSRTGSAKVKAFTNFLLEVFNAQRLPGNPREIGIKAIARR